MTKTATFDPTLQLVINAAPVAIAYIDTDQRYRFANVPYGELHGKPTDQVIGHTVREVVGGEIYEMLRGRLEAALRGERIKHEGRQPIGPHGSLFRIVDYVPEAGPDGIVRGVIVVITDITERKQAEDELRAAHRQAVEILENMSDAFYSLDREFRFTYINRHAEELWGRRREDLLGKVIWDEFPKAVGSHPYSEHLRAAAGDEPVSFETVSPMIGRWVYVTISPTSSGVSVFFRDITERKQREERLTTLHRIAAALSEAVTPAQVQNVIVAHAEQHLGGHLVTLVLYHPDREVLELVRHHDLPETLQQTFRAFPVTATLPIAQAVREAQPVWLESLDAIAAHYPAILTLSQPITGTQAMASLPLMIKSNVIGALGISYPEPRQFDPEERAFLTTLAHECAQALERARLYEIEATARAEAEKLNRLQTEFLAMISHELRTPLTSIKGFASTLLATDVDFDPGTQREFVRIINDESDKLHNLIEHLLMLTRMQAGSFAVQPQPLTVAELLERIMPQLYMLTEHHHPHIDVPRALPPVCVDAMRIGQVLLNLVENACKYSKEGSDVAITAREHPEGVLISVADSGQGISADEHEQVFKAFYRGRGSPGEVVSGSGLGLAVARGILEAHGGHIWIERSDHSGTTIAFTLPICS